MTGGEEQRRWTHRKTDNEAIREVSTPLPVIFPPEFAKRRPPTAGATVLPTPFGIIW
jgi:hypothetical protein